MECEQMAKKAKWRRHTVEFKRQVVEQMKTCQNIHELARELNIQRKLLYTWKYQFEGRPEPRHANLGVTAEDRKEKHLREEIVKLKTTLADKTLENDFFRSALLKIKEGRQRNIETGASASTTSSSRGRKSKAC
jgi:transposase-like protein